MKKVTGGNPVTYIAEFDKQCTVCYRCFLRAIKNLLKCIFVVQYEIHKPAPIHKLLRCILYKYMHTILLNYC